VTKKEIDHMLTRNRKDFVSYQVYRGAENPGNTDHRLNMVRHRVNLVSVKPRLAPGDKINTDALRQDVALQLRYASGIRNALGTPDKEHYYNDIADHAESSIRRHDLKAVYKSIRLICGSAASSQSMPIARTDGILCRSAAEELDRWPEHYETTLNHPTAGPYKGIDRLAAFNPSEDGVKTDAPTVPQLKL